MNKKILTIGIILLVASVVTATILLYLFPYDPLHPPKVDDVGSSTEGIKEVVDANNRFAFELYAKVDKSKNVFYSPYSISQALAMTYEGAKTETKEEIKSVFHFPDDAILRANSAAVYNGVNENNKEFELRTGNALWAQYDYKFLPEYISNVEKYYGGKVSNLDFKKETEKSRETINNFIAEQTNNKIKDLVPQGGVNEWTRLVLTNAIYFKGDWEWEFDKSDTSEQVFRVNSTDLVKTQMMSMKPEKATFNYSETDKFQLLELPYKGGKISMLILLPKQGTEYDFETGKTIVSNYTLEDIEVSLDKLKEYKQGLKESTLDVVSIPKFEFDTKYSLKETLSALGMPSAFNNADFSGMDGTKNLAISEVIHQAYIKVDEKGTEAAAATAVMMKFTAIAKRNVFRADHPFMFIIEDTSTDNILFMGRVVDPTKK